jgi:uncharacterized protein
MRPDVQRRYVTADDLPGVVPVFPLEGALLLPQTDLPLNIFEPRYLEMVDDAMSGNRLIGMIQPAGEATGDRPILESVGCLGRITSYAEVGEGRLQIILEGVCRFRVARELEGPKLYRLVEADYVGFTADMLKPTTGENVNRKAVIPAFRQYLEANNMSANWDEVERIPTELLVNTLSQLAPYAAAEKQALLEADDVQARADLLIALTELALSKPRGRLHLQ